MRHLLVTAFVIAAGSALASSAHASSIEPLVTHDKGAKSSFITRTCSNCPPPVGPRDNSGYKVPVLKDGVQSVEIVEIDGEKKIVRTESWMGGSPVVYVSKVPDWMNKPAAHAEAETGTGISVEQAIETATPQPNRIDFDAQTGAVQSNMAPDFEETPLRTE